MKITTAFLLLILVGCGESSPTGSSGTSNWVTVGGAGNACDKQAQGCFGSVADTYLISKYETTNAQYAKFLNAVGTTDANALYNTEMGSDLAPDVGGITRSGTSGGFSYSAIAGREDMPVNWVSFWDAARFANWLHNGQPTGVQDNTTTEDGAYTLTATGIKNNTVTRNAGAEAFVTGEDEWYKAAYYDAASTSYFVYPTGSDIEPVCATPGATANTANCNNAVVDLTDVGSYTGAASPNGTFDQGGNVWEWNEAIVGSKRLNRALRGGAFNTARGLLEARARFGFDPATEFDNAGFRIASMP